MPKSKRALNRRSLISLLVIILFAYLVLTHLTIFGNILLVMIGFGAVIFIHELGHFTAAKLSGIKVEAFSIGMGPILIGLSRCQGGYKIRILPGLINNEDEESPQGGICFTIPAKTKAGETEYRISLIPFGGFVKMLGQDDIGQVEKSDDPRSFSNKPVGARFAVIASGVFFNAISAVLLFIITFMIGIQFPPAIVGGVAEGSSAAKAGLKAGDEIIEIDGRSKDLDFRDIMFAALLSDWAQEVPFKVKHEDGSVEQVYLTAKKMDSDPMRKFGISWPYSLEIAEVSDATALTKATKLQPGDRIISVNGEDVEYYWQFEEIIQTAFFPTVSMLTQRPNDANEAPELIETKIPLAWPVDTGSGLANVCSIVPRLRVYAVSQPNEHTDDGILFKLRALLAKTGISQESEKYVLALEPNDIIISAGDVNFPTYHELGKVTTEHEGKDLPMTVLRRNDSGDEELVDITVKPMKKGERVIIGFAPVLDVEHPVVAKTIETDANLGDFAIPPGATITSVNGEKVSDFLAVARQIAKSSENKVIIEYLSMDGKKGSAVLDTPEKLQLINMEPSFTVSVPFEPMKITHKADGPIEAVSMGFRKTIRMIMMTYASFKVIARGDVGMDNVTGPVGILHLSYQVASTEPMIYYVYLMGFLSIAIAVFNFMPLLPLDGGWALFLIIEKIKGSPINPKIIVAAAGFGWILIGALVIFLTVNDIARMIFG